MKKLLIVAALAACSFLTGCASASGTPTFNLNAQTGAAVAQIAAKDGTYLALKQNPQWRPQFQQALDEITVLANADKIDVAALAAIVQRLPVKQLQGDTAKLIIGDVQIVVQQITNGGVIVGQDKYTDAKTIIGGIRDGIKMGMDMAPIPQASNFVQLRPTFALGY